MTRTTSSHSCSTSFSTHAGRRNRASAHPRRGARRCAPTGDIDVLTTTLIVDDLVFADGTTKMAVLGGGGAQTAFGASMYSEDIRVALVAGVGEKDCPQECVRWLTERGVHASLIPQRGMSTPRAWQITENDGRRTQVWRIDADEALYSMLRPRFDTWPEDVRHPRACHFGLNPARPDFDLVHDLRGAGVQLISVEPFTHATRPISTSSLKALVTMADVFSPNILEARSLFIGGERLSAKDLIRAMADAGGKILCLRMGEDGAIVYDAEANVGYSAPACARNVVDPTGCGNSFCGGFVAALLESNDIRKGLTLGSAAASIMLEHVGVPMGTLDVHRREAHVRAEALCVESFTL